MEIVLAIILTSLTSFVVFFLFRLLYKRQKSRKCNRFREQLKELKTGHGAIKKEKYDEFRNLFLEVVENLRRNKSTDDTEVFSEFIDAIANTLCEVLPGNFDVERISQVLHDLGYHRETHKDVIRNSDESRVTTDYVYRSAALTAYSLGGFNLDPWMKMVLRGIRDSEIGVVARVHNFLYHCEQLDSLYTDMRCLNYLNICLMKMSGDLADFLTEVLEKKELRVRELSEILSKIDKTKSLHYSFSTTVKEEKLKAVYRKINYKLNNLLAEFKETTVV